MFNTEKSTLMKTGFQLSTTVLQYTMPPELRGGKTENSTYHLL